MPPCCASARPFICAVHALLIAAALVCWLAFELLPGPVALVAIVVLLSSGMLLFSIFRPAEPAEDIPTMKAEDVAWPLDEDIECIPLKTQTLYRYNANLGSYEAAAPHEYQLIRPFEVYNHDTRRFEGFPLDKWELLTAQLAAAQGNRGL